MRRRPSTLLVALLTVSALSAACGLKQDQLDALKSQGPGTTTLSDGTGAAGVSTAVAPGGTAATTAPGAAGSGAGTVPGATGTTTAGSTGA
ncbi:MAG: hypothetical protein ACXVGH_10400, partial [Mycobacteriales bacterium]